MPSLVRHLAEEPAFVGIGYAKAARLAQAFGTDLPRMLAANDPTPFVPLVGQSAAEALVAAWLEDLARGDIVVWLEENGIDPRLATKIVRLWGAEGARHVRAHPYALMALADWPVVDAAARKLGTALDDPERLVAAVEAVLYGRLQQQHTWTGDAMVKAQVRKLIGAAPRIVDAAVRSAEAVGAAVPAKAGWQPAGAAMMEAYVAARLRAMVEEPVADDLFARDVPDAELHAWLDGSGSTLGVALGGEQQAAVRLAVQGRFGMVLGGAGVGKTTVLRAVCGASEAFGRGVHLMALAGRAAVRMREATGRPASTIAAFLKGCESGSVEIGPGSMVVVDEASMVDLPTMYRILRHLPDGARLLLVGDEAQLGPIGFGLVFHALVDMPFAPRVRLTRIYRQAEQSGIPVVTAAVRAGTLPDLPSRVGLGSGVVMKALDRAPTAEDVVDVVADLGNFGGDLRILSPVKAGPAGTVALNERFHAIMAVGRRRMPGRRFALGEPVMFGRNDYERDLRNGSLGTVVDIQGAALVTDFDGVEHVFEGAALDDVTLAYAITVHKAQGSQFHTVVVPVIPSRILDRSLVYTALTRATHRVVLVGRREVLERAVAAPASADLREVGLRWL